VYISFSYKFNYLTCVCILLNIWLLLSFSSNSNPKVGTNARDNKQHKRSRVMLWKTLKQIKVFIFNIFWTPKIQELGDSQLPPL